MLIDNLRKAGIRDGASGHTEWVTKPPIRYLNSRCVKSRSLLPERHQHTSPGQSDAVTTAKRRPGFVELPFPALLRATHSVPKWRVSFMETSGRALRRGESNSAATGSGSLCLEQTRWPIRPVDYQRGGGTANDQDHPQPHRSAPPPPAQKRTRFTDSRFSRPITNPASARFDQQQVKAFR